MAGMVRSGDIWVGTCALGHPPGLYGPSLPTVPIPVTGTVVGTASTCLAEGKPKAKVGMDLVISGCGHIAFIVTGALFCKSEGMNQAIVGSIACAGITPLIITGTIVSGSSTCSAS